MTGLSSNFGDQLLWVGLAVLVTLVVVGVVALVVEEGDRVRWALRALAAGSALVVLLATATGPVRFDGDLVLQPGGAGLGDLNQVIADPTSLAAVLLFSNVALYVPVGLFGSLGWPSRRSSVLVAALVLSIVVEGVQLGFLGRVASTDDVLLNFLGALIGYLVAPRVVPSTASLDSRA